MNGKKIKQARVALGGVSHKPWRATEVEKYLAGKDAIDANFIEAANAEMKNAKGFEHNKFKIELGKRAIVKALRNALNNRNG